MSADQSRKIMETYLNEVLAKRDFDRVNDIAGAQMIDHTQPALRGPEALYAHAKGFCENTPDVEIEVVDIFATEDRVVGLWRWRGEPARPSGVSSSGAPVVPRFICSVFQIEDGRISDYRVFVDAVDVFTQMAQ